MPKPPPSSSPFWKVFQAGANLNVRLYRLSGGKIGGRMQKAKVLLLHHVGRKSGTERVTPLLFMPDGEDLAQNRKRTALAARALRSGAVTPEQLQRD